MQTTTYLQTHSQVGQFGHVFRLVELGRVDLVNIRGKHLVELAVPFLLDNDLLCANKDMQTGASDGRGKCNVV